jgi:hypothetical protein
MSNILIFILAAILLIINRFPKLRAAKGEHAVSVKH